MYLKKECTEDIICLFYFCIQDVLKHKHNSFKEVARVILHRYNIIIIEALLNALRDSKLQNINNIKGHLIHIINLVLITNFVTNHCDAN